MPLYFLTPCLEACCNGQPSGLGMCSMTWQHAAGFLFIWCTLHMYCSYPMSKLVYYYLQVPLHYVALPLPADG